MGHFKANVTAWTFLNSLLTYIDLKVAFLNHVCVPGGLVNALLANFHWKNELLR